MRDRNVFSFKRSLPRMSWHPHNLFNLWNRTAGPKSNEIKFRIVDSTLKLFAQRFRSKAAVRAYHGDYIPEKIFKRWFLPDTLPDVRPRRAIKRGDDRLENELFAKRRKKEEDYHAEEVEKGMAPVGSLMFSEVERRLDTLVFRCCFAHSVYEARRLVIHGDVLLNGKVHTVPGTRLAPGDMISVNPEAIRFFKKHHSQPQDDVNAILNPHLVRPTVEEKVTVEVPQDFAVTRTLNELSYEDTTEDKSASTLPEANSTERAELSPSNSVTPSATQQEHFSKEKRPALTPFFLPQFASPWLFIPAYIEPNFATCSAVYVRHPTAGPGYSEIPTPYDADGEVIRFAWEWYVRNRPRIRSRSQFARMPEDRAFDQSIVDKAIERRRFKKILKRRKREITQGSAI